MKENNKSINPQINSNKETFTHFIKGKLYYKINLDNEAGSNSSSDSEIVETGTVSNKTKQEVSKKSTKSKQMGSIKTLNKQLSIKSK